MFRKILIANRGEIASRIIRACHELGITAVALYSDADADMPWVRQADEAYRLPGTAATDTYLNQPAIFDIVQQCGAEAIHPGYGFLSENADFAAACAQHGVVFIGPTPEAMRQMGSKAAAREVAQRAGVPIAPGIDTADMNAAQVQQAADEIGYPLLIKASAGGGGKGMRVVRQAADFADALQAARSEARSAFGDDHILVERYFTQIHHVEVQILADQHGRVLHLFERECSIQRRHQKIIEESPAPIIGDNDVLRRDITQAAVALAAAVGYTNAGTVEFIVDEDGRFYFLEMNTRLQVEHPITELVTGTDLATWQIRIANNEQLDFAQEDVTQRGHAFECRLYAEDPANHFLPSIGDLAVYAPPSGPGVRVDDGVAAGTAVSPYYDPMLAKLITWGRTRSEALAKMRQALAQTAVVGVTTNLAFLRDIFEEPDFIAGHTSTNYLETHFAEWPPDLPVTDDLWAAAALFEWLQSRSGSGNGRLGATPDASRQPDPWQTSNGWRNVRV